MKNLLWSICTTFLFVALAFTATAQDDNPKISIQGTLKDANSIAVDDGQQTITFRLYDAETGGTVKHEEIGDVQVRGGVYNYLLGTEEDLDPAAFATPLYLSLEVNGNELFPRTPMTYSPYSLSVSTAQQAIGLASGTNTCSGSVGDIKYSILNPTDFAKENGDCWVPMDGQAIPGTKLADTYGWSNVPDMSGLFVRATEYNDGNDPDRTDMSIPTVQGDENKAHDHTASEAGGHTHYYTDAYLQGIQLSGTATDSMGIALNRNDVQTIKAYYTDTNKDRYTFYNDIEGGLVTTRDGDHTHIISSSGGAEEARPKNMNFYIYIRVD